MMKKLRILFLSCLLAASACAFTACGNDNTTDPNQNTNNAGNANTVDPTVDDGIDDTNGTNGMDNNGGSVENQLDDAGQDLENMGDDALDAIENGAGAAGDAIEDGVEGVGDVIDGDVGGDTNGTGVNP